MVLNKSLLAFIASIIVSFLMINLIRSWNLPTFVTFSMAIYASYILMFLAMLHHYISQSKKVK